MSGDSPDFIPEEQHPDFIPDPGKTAPAPANEGGAVSRFLTRATGLPVQDIAAHPGAYINPFSKQYWQKGKEQNAIPVTAPSLRQMIPFGQTSKDIADKNYAGAAGDIIPGAIQLGMAFSGGKGSGEWVDPQPIHYAGPDAPAVAKPQVYRKGPGEVVPDVVGQTNGNILAGGKGVIVRPPKLLKAAQPYRAINMDSIDDAGVNQEMAKSLDQHEESAMLEEGRDFAEKNSADIPKWKRLAQFRAQMAAENVLKEAELAQQIPARATKTRVPKAPATKQDILNPGGEDLTGILEESLKQVRAKKGQPKAEK